MEKMLKIGFIFGKGIDGCGVTRGAILFEKFLRDNGHDTIVVDFDNDQLFGRAADARFIGEVLTVTKKDTDASQAILDKVNQLDIAIFHSHPTRKQENFVERYRRFMEKIDGPIIVMHDHAIAKTNVNAIPQACELFSKADVIVVQSIGGFSEEAYTAFDKNLIGRVIENPIWMAPHSLDKFYKPFEEREKHLIYIGRMSPLKDPAMVCRIEPHIAEPWKMSLVGCEYSISSVDTSRDVSINPSPYTPHHRKKIHQYRTRSDGSLVLTPNGAQLDFPARITSYDKYKHDWGMERLGKSMASWCGYRLTETKEYGSRMEYTMIESFLLTLPVINRHFADNAKSPEGKLWGEYSGPLVSQMLEEKELAAELERVSNNKDEWMERSAACKELIHKFNDIEVIGPKFLEQVIALGKRKNKVDPMSVISSYFPDAQERRNKGEIVMTSASAFLKSTPLILVDGKQVEPTLTPTSSLEEFFA
jgi:hypothetical protein